MFRTFPILVVAAIAAPTAAQQNPQPRGVIMTVDPPRGPTPAENIWLRPGHINSDDRMFPDIAVKDVRIDGDTLYVLVANVGQLGTQSTVHVSARAEAGGIKTDVASSTAGKLKSGESRWVSLRGFSMKTASSSAPVFALDSASIVAASASLPRVIPSALDRSGQGCNRCADPNGDNDRLVMAGTSIKRGKPE